MPRFRSLLLRLLPTLALAVMGALLRAWLIPLEMRSIEEQLTGFPDSDVSAHLARPYVLTALCFLPALVALIYACGSTLDRHIARQFGKIFFLCVASLLLIWMLIDFAENLRDFRKSPNGTLVTAAMFYRVRAPAILLLLLPYALLLSLIYALGKFSRDREIVPMIQSGRSLIRLTAPLIISGIACSLFCLGINYHWAPTAEGRISEILDAARGILITEAKHVIYNNPDNHRLWMVGAFPKNYEKGEPLINVEVTTTRPDGSLASRLIAKRARWERKDGSWMFEGPVICHYADGQVPGFETPASPLRQLWPETPWQLIKPGLAAQFLGIPDLNGWLRANAAKRHTLPNKHTASPYLTQWHYRWALPFSCLVNVLLAAPLSIHFSRRGPGGNIFLAIVLSGLMLFTTSVILNFGEAGILHPALAAWLPNLVFALFGLFLFHRRIADRPVYQSILRFFRIIK